ncbi:hypothetical protein F5887DRAFT_123267 [Amanita rubescens]|nr:hypothetical protein F5887DRAFT_123267 [Amanita rubescens]
MSNLQLEIPRDDEDGQIINLSSIGQTNKVYSKKEEAFIRSVQLTAETLLQSGTVDGDLERKGGIVDLICRCKIALASHKCLPPDVLRFIFQICAETRVEFSLSRPGVDLRLLRITHVCSAWRQMALETPTLWNKIGITLDHAYQDRNQETFYSARQWFDRAQNIRRSLFVRLDEYYGARQSRESWEQLLDFMALHRLEELELKYPINSLALKLPAHVWSSIERLHLICVGEGSDNPGRQPLFSNFGKLSNLRHLKIHNSLNLRDMDEVVPWYQLRSLDIFSRWRSDVTLSLCLNVLRQGSLLEYFDVTLEDEPSFISTAIPEEKIILANMDYFRLEFVHSLQASALFQLLVIPNITTLIIEPAFLCTEECPPFDVGTWIELLPSLESILITPGFLTDNAIERLSSGKLGARLRVISLQGFLHNADKILSMVKLRYRNATEPSDGKQIEIRLRPFKSVSISCTPVDNPELYHKRVAILEKNDVYINIGLDEDELFEDDESRWF